MEFRRLFAVCVYAIVRRFLPISFVDGEELNESAPYFWDKESFKIQCLYNRLYPLYSGKVPFTKRYS